MPVGNGKNNAHSAEAAPIDALTPRDTSGRFGAGNKYSRGRPRTSITRELRRQTDTASIARFLVELVGDPKAPMRERLQAAAMITDRLEGKPIARSISMHGTASALLPPGFDQMSASARARVLDDLRTRALAGDSLLLDRGNDDGDE